MRPTIFWDDLAKSLERVMHFFTSREGQDGLKCKEDAGANAQVAYQAIEHSQLGRRGSLIRIGTRSRGKVHNTL